MATLSILRAHAGAWADARRVSFARLRSSRFMRNAGILSGGSAIGHAFTLALAPVLTRLYSPGQFGILGLFTSFLSIAGVAGALQYEFSIVSSTSQDEAEYLTLASLFFAVPVSALAGVVLWLLIQHSLLGFGDLPGNASLLLSLAMCFVGVFTAMRYWCVREEQFGQISRGVVAQSAARAVFQAIFGAIGFGSAGLLVGETAGRCLGMSRMLSSAGPMLRRRLARFRCEEFTTALLRNWKFPLFSLPSSFVDALNIGLVVPLLIRLYGTDVGGHYSLVWRAITLPSVLVSLAVADTLHGRLSICSREAPDKIRGVFDRSAIFLLALGFVPAAVLWLWGVPLFRWTFGSQWSLAGNIAAAVAPWYLAKFVVSPLSRVVVVFGRQELKLVWDVLSLASLLAVFSIARLRAIAPLQTIRTLSWLNTGLYGIYFLLLLWITTRFRGAATASAASV